MPSIISLVTALGLSVAVLAKTDLVGCTSSLTTAFGGASVLWYDPTNGEICEALDCGGGRAPPKTTVPGCAAYSGTATYSPSYLSNWGSATATPSKPASSVLPSAIYPSSKSKYTSVSKAPVTSDAPVAASSTFSTLPLTYFNGTISLSATASLSASPTTSPSVANSNAGAALGSNVVVAAGAALVGLVML
jgi:hypothetical protein